MEPYDEARQMLAAASRDFRALTGMFEPEVFADEVFGFHVQQAVEKALKAWLSLLSVEYPRTHDISLLLGILDAKGERVELFEDLVEFNSYAVQYRYEAFTEVGEPLERPSVTRRVEELLRLVQLKVDQSTRR